jgi:hypothetical protein
MLTEIGELRRERTAGMLRQRRRNWEYGMTTQ